MALEWQPEYPDWIPRPFRRATYEPVIRQNISPIALPTPPTELIWLGSHPAQIWRRTLPAAPRAVIVAPIPFVSLYTPTSWQSIYPAWLSPPPRLAVQLQQVQPFTISSLIGVGTLGAWRPTFPAQIWSRPQTRTGVQWWLVDPTTLLNAAVCIEITDEDRVGPDLTGEVVLDPTLTGETLVSPTFTGEDLC